MLALLPHHLFPAWFLVINWHWLLIFLRIFYSCAELLLFQPLVFNIWLWDVLVSPLWVYPTWRSWMEFLRGIHSFSFLNNLNTPIFVFADSSTFSHTLVVPSFENLFLLTVSHFCQSVLSQQQKKKHRGHVQTLIVKSFYFYFRFYHPAELLVTATIISSQCSEDSSFLLRQLWVK